MLLIIGNNRDMVITSHQSIMRLVTWPGPGHTGAISNIDPLVSNETRWPHSVTNHPASIRSYEALVSYVQVYTETDGDRWGFFSISK